MYNAQSMKYSSKQDHSDFEHEIVLSRMLQWTVGGAAGQVGSPVLTKLTQNQDPEKISAAAGRDSVITHHPKMVAHLVWELQ